MSSYNLLSLCVLPYQSAYKKEWDPRDVLNDGKKGLKGLKRAGIATTLEELGKLPILHVLCTANNTYINICDHTGRILTWKSAVRITSLALCF